MSKIEIIPQPTADGTDTLFSWQYNQTYHSTHGALTETEHIFLRGTGVRQRLEHKQTTCILEVGFGTGLNFWATAQLALQHQTPLHYVALEQNLLSAELLSQLNHHLLSEEVEQLRTAFLVWRRSLPDPLSGHFEWHFGEYIHLSLVVGDAAQVDLPDLTFDAIYHDAFSPDANPELWTPRFFSRLYPRLATDGKLATYSVKGAVRRALQQVGFQVEKHPGPPGKREMLVAWRV